jgi:transcriptional regulator with XRE-family HTH domain
MQGVPLTRPATGFRDNERMKKTSSRQILAENLARAMARSADMQNNLALARRAKVGNSHIGRILKQESAATVDMLDALAAALGLQPWELLTDSEATREAALKKIMFGSAVPDEQVEKHLPPAPRPKVIAMRRRSRE